jgi:VCBS repeat-containing protein
MSTRNQRGASRHQAKQAVRRRNRFLSLERLESRYVLDGNVHAFVRGGDLHITGDSAGNEITITQSASNSFTISSRDGATTINGQSADVTLNARHNVIISMGSGDDVVDFDGTAGAMTIHGRLTANMGGGADQLLLEDVALRGMTINMGSGNDLLNLGSDGADTGVTSSKVTVINMGSGVDDARIANSNIYLLVMNMGGQNDSLTIQDTSVHRRSVITGGPGRDTLNRQGNSGKIKYLSFEVVNNSVIAPSPVPPIATSDTATVLRGQSTTINVAANDTAASGTLNLSSITITQAPTHGTAVANTDGTVTYTNNGDTAATDSFQYTIKDSAGTTSNAATVSITVNGPLAANNDTATIAEDATPNTVTGNVLTNDTGGSGTTTVSAVNGSAASVGADVPGTFGTFHINSNGAFTYTLDNTNTTVNALAAGQTLTDSMGYTATAGGQTSNATLNVTIDGHTDVAAAPDAGDVTEDAATNTATGNVLTNDTGTGLTVSAVNGSAAGVGTDVPGTFGTFHINSNGAYTYTLDNTNATVNGLSTGQTLTDAMGYTTTDGVQNTSSTLTVTIHGHTDVAAAADANDVTEDSATNTATGNVLANDTGVGLTVSAVSGSAGNVGTDVTGTFGTFHINSNGTYTYTLDNTNAAVNALATGQTLTDAMGYTATDGVQTSSSTLTITIHGHTDIVATDDTANVTEDANPPTATGNVLSNDTGTGLTVTAVSGSAANVGTDVPGAFGTFHIGSDGAFTYTLDNANPTVNALNDGDTLSDSISYTAGDGIGAGTATLAVTIHGHTDTSLSAINDTASVAEDATPNTATGNVLDNDTNAAGAKSVSGVNGSAANVGTDVPGAFGTFHIDSTGSFTYTLDNTNATVNALNSGGTLSDAISYTATDGSTSSSATLTVTIHGHTDVAATADTNDVTEDATPNTATGNVLTNDVGVGLTVSAVDGSAANVGADVPGAFGIFHIGSDGSYTYTLDNTNATVNALANGQTLTDSLGYTAADGTQTSSSTLTITIHGHTDVAANPDTNDVTEDAATNTATGNVLTNDVGVGLTVSAVNGSAANVGADVPGTFGTFHIGSDGAYTYTLDNTNATVNALNDGETLTDAMGYTATDGTQSSSSTLTVTIHGHTDVAANPDTNDVTEDATPNTATGNVLTNDSGTGLTVSAVNGSAASVGADVPGSFGTFHIGSDGTYTYTLDNTNATVNALDNGNTLTDAMGYTATDGTQTSSSTLTVTIHGNTDGTFTAVNDSADITEDATPDTVTGNVLDNDTAGGPVKVVTAVNGDPANVGTSVAGAHGTFLINSDGTFTYTLNNADPALNALDDGQTLADSVSYTAVAGNQAPQPPVESSGATLTVTIHGHTDTVIANADTNDVTEDDPTNTATGNVLANDTGTGLTVTAVSGSAANVSTDVPGTFGTFHIASDGSYTYTLDNNNATVNALAAGQTLTDSIAYSATDGTETSSSTLTITIHGHTDVVANNDPADITEDATPNSTTGNVLTNDAGVGLTVSAVDGSAAGVNNDVPGTFGTFHIGSDGTFTYTLDNTNTTVNDLNTGDTLTDSIDYTTTDGTQTGAATITVTIHGNTDSP